MNQPTPTIKDFSDFIYNYLNGLRGLDERKHQIVAKFEAEASMNDVDVDMLFRSYVDKYMNMSSAVASQRVHETTPSVEHYRQYLVKHLGWMEPRAKQSVSDDFVKAAQKTNKPQSCFANFIETYGSGELPEQSIENVRKTVQVNLSKDVADIASKLNERLNDYVPPKIETSPLKRLASAQTRIKNLVSKCSAEIGGVDVSEYCKQKALEGLNVQSIKPEDKIKDKYNYSSQGSFAGKKLTLELVVSR